MIPKKSNDPLDPSSYRPISHLEVLYKLISKIFSSKLEPLVYNSVLPSQYGFVPNKHMSTLSLLLSHILRLGTLPSNRHNPFALIFIDIKAAFDTALHAPIKWIFENLAPHSRLPSLFHSWFSDATAQISLNNHNSNPLSLHRGVGQGDPASTVRYLALHHLFTLIFQRN